MLILKLGFLEGLRMVGVVKVARMRVLKAVTTSALKELSLRDESGRLWPRLSRLDLLVFWTYRISLLKRLR